MAGAGTGAEIMAKVGAGAGAVAGVEIIFLININYSQFGGC